MQKKITKFTKAESFIATRNHHISETAEDYVEMVADLIHEKGEARVCDIAQNLGVSHVAVVRMVKRLKKKGFVHSEPHQSITLTHEGSMLASLSKKKHSFLLEYLIALGVPEDIAAIDVEGMEHHISEETIEAFQKHLDKVKKYGS